MRFTEWPGKVLALGPTEQKGRAEREELKPRQNCSRGWGRQGTWRMGVGFTFKAVSES